MINIKNKENHSLTFIDNNFKKKKNNNIVRFDLISFYEVVMHIFAIFALK